jgi:hypothetical protein
VVRPGADRLTPRALARMAQRRDTSASSGTPKAPGMPEWLVVAAA